jgi:hypothetical protein
LLLNVIEEESGVVSKLAEEIQAWTNIELKT